MSNPKQPSEDTHPHASTSSPIPALPRLTLDPQRQEFSIRHLPDICHLTPQRCLPSPETKQSGYAVDEILCGEGTVVWAIKLNLGVGDRAGEGVGFDEGGEEGFYGAAGGTPGCGEERD